MAYYPTSATGLNFISYPVGPTANGGLDVATANAANTKGSYVELINSTPFATNWIVIDMIGANTTGQRYLFDVATGGAGAESNFINNVMVEGAANSSGQACHGAYWIPVAIPASSRISIRAQSNAATTKHIFVQITLINAGTMPGLGLSAINSYGADTANSRGQMVDPGGVADTKGAYTQITASTTGVSQWLMIAFTFGGNSAPVSAVWAVDLATGGAGAETVLIPDLRIVTTGGMMPSPPSFSFPIYIVGSTRLAVRASCSIIDATDRLISCMIYGATAPAEGGSGGGNFVVCG